MGIAIETTIITGGDVHFSLVVFATKIKNVG